MVRGHIHEFVLAFEPPLLLVIAIAITVVVAAIVRGSSYSTSRIHRRISRTAASGGSGIVGSVIGQSSSSNTKTSSHFLFEPQCGLQGGTVWVSDYY